MRFRKRRKQIRKWLTKLLFSYAFIRLEITLWRYTIKLLLYRHLIAYSTYDFKHILLPLTLAYPHFHLMVNLLNIMNSWAWLQSLCENYYKSQVLVRYTLDISVDWLTILNSIWDLYWLNPIHQNYAWKIKQTKQTKTLPFTDFFYDSSDPYLKDYSSKQKYLLVTSIYKCLHYKWFFLFITSKSTWTTPKLKFKIRPLAWFGPV